MKLFKLILFFFAVYFVRRFWQLFKAMEKREQDLKVQEETLAKQKQSSADGKVVEAEYKVVDHN